MHIERIHEMIESLTKSTLCELDKGIENIDACELSQAIEMIDKLNEAEYFALVAKAMKEHEDDDEKEPKGSVRNPSLYSYMPSYNPVTQPANHSYTMTYTDGYQKGYEEGSRRNTQEGMSGKKRLSFMNTKTIHSSNSSSDHQANMEALQEYMESLSTDLTELISMCSPEEKMAIKTKLNTLAGKIV